MRTMRASQIFLLPRKKGNILSRSSVTKMLIDGGFVRKVADGLYAYLPLGMSLIRNIGLLFNNEMKRLGGNELLLPVLGPGYLWDKNEIAGVPAQELLLVNDHKGTTLALAPRYEEAVVSVMRELLKEDGQLPAIFFQTQARIRDIAATQQTTIGAMESLVGDSWSFHKTESDLNNFVPRVYGALSRVLCHCGLSPLVSEGISNGRDRSFDFIVTQRGGSYRVVTCTGCDYVADQQVAVGVGTSKCGKLMALSEGSRNDIPRFQDLGKTIGVPSSRVAFCSMYSTDAGFVMAVHRADHHLSLAKLSKVVGARIIAVVHDEDIVDLGLAPGFFSPLGQNLDRMSETGIGIVVDPLVAETQNLVIAGNAKGSYFVNANFGRDFEGHIVADISLVDERHKCYHCGGELKLLHALKIAAIVRQNTDFSSRLNFSVRDHLSGRALFPLVGSYWLSMDALVAGIAHVFQDKRGIVWPLQVAPYKTLLVVVGKSESLRRVAHSIHETMGDLTLWDDRSMSFADRLHEANLMGIPIRVIVSAQTLKEQTVTVLYRRDGSSRKVAVHRLKSHILDMWKAERSPVKT